MQQQLSLADAIVSITNTYGVDILKDGNRFCAILGDIAPTLDKERKIIRRAKDEDVLPLIWDAYSVDATKRTDILSRIEYLLKSEAGFSEEWCNILINGFSEAFAWSMPITIATPAPAVITTPSEKKKYFTKNIARNTFSASPKQIVLPEKYNVVGEHAFDYIWQSVHVDNITIPNGYIEIQRYAFHPLKVDQFISIPDSVVEIDDNAFTLEKYAYVLCSPSSYAYTFCKSHYLANSVDGIPERPEHIRLGKESSIQIHTEASVDEYLDTKYQELIIPAGTTSVEKSAFRNRSDIELVFADNSLKYIKKGAFANCKSLQCVYLGYGVQSIASDAFANCSNLKIVYINLKGDWFKQFDRILDRESEEISIADTAFSGCTQLKYIVSVGYSQALDKICRSLQLTYIYDDISLHKKSSCTIPKELELLNLHVLHRVEQLHF